MEQNTPKGNLPVNFTENVPLTMTSREIADVCGKEHGHVLRDIRDTFSTLGEDASKFGGIYLDAYKREKPCYYLPEREAMILASGYDVVLRAKIVDQWQSLKEQASGGFALPQTYEQALEGLLAKVRENSALMIENRAKDATISAMQPKVDAYEAYLSEEGVCRIMDFCNKHGVKKNHPGYVLRDKGLLCQSTKKVLATQIGLKSGILKNVLEKTGFEYIDSKGQSVEAQQAMVVRQREISLLKMIVDAYGLTAFRNPVAFARAKALIGGGK